MVSNELKEILSNLRAGEKTSNGYLVCQDCLGYYQLQEGELASDFDFCECGGKLSFYADIDDFYYISEDVGLEVSEDVGLEVSEDVGLEVSEDVGLEVSEDVGPEISEEEAVEITSFPLESEEMTKILTNLKNKAEKRKKLFEDLAKKIRIQEELLNEIKQGKWDSWKGVAVNNLHSDITEQKRLIEDIIEQEERDIFDDEELIDTIIHEESKFVNLIQEKRDKIGASRSWSLESPLKSPDFIKQWDNDYVGLNLNFIKTLSLFFIFLIIIGFVYLYFVWVLT